MSETKTLLKALLWDIYGKQKRSARRQRRRYKICDSRQPRKQGSLVKMSGGMSGNKGSLQQLDVQQLNDVCAILKVEMVVINYLLERVLITRDRLRQHQDVLFDMVTASLVVISNDAQPKMRFSLSPPPPKAVSVSVTSPTSNAISSNNNNSAIKRTFGRSRNNNNMLARSKAEEAAAITAADEEDAASDYNQWLHAMKLVARLPGGTPPEFRRKLWLSLADKYLKSKNVDWSKQREKCFCEEWREDDEELGIQIVKDLHRTGSNLCTGPAGSINQAKLKRILLGYARYNPEVGYCQGFNMLGALILQVMDKEEEESMKVMIYLVEGVLPTGYFCGSMGGLQADMGVFRELMQTKLPRLAKHLQKLQGGPVENVCEPPLTNVFTMQWFLTMFCTCLPMSCVLRVWDLVLIEGSDVLLRTALVLWSLLEERVLNARTADDFYGKMGSFSSELLNGHLIDSNGLIEKVVQLGPIADIRQLRDKHLYNIAPLRHKQGLQLYYDDDEDPHTDEESRLAVATVWGLNWTRRGSMGGPNAGKQPQQASSESKDRLALDISLLKKQYDRLRERQKQAHVILTTACSTAARQAPPSNATTSSGSAVPVNQLLLGRPAIVTNKGKRIGAPQGAIPPARKPSLPAVLQTKPPEKTLRRGETLLWRDTDPSKRRRDSLTWKEIKADRAAMLREGVDVNTLKSQKLRSRLGKSDSSSYSEESDGEGDGLSAGVKAVDGAGDASSTDTSLCDDDDPASAKSLEQSPKLKAKLARKLKEGSKPSSGTGQSVLAPRESSVERKRPKSWAPGTNEIPFMLMGTDSGDEKESATYKRELEEDSATESGHFASDWPSLGYSKVADDLSIDLKPLHVETDLPSITSTSQLSPLPDIVAYLNTTSISPLPTPKPTAVSSDELEKSSSKTCDVNDAGVTNEYFERVNSVERPTKLDLLYSLNEPEEHPMSEEQQRTEVDGELAAPARQLQPEQKNNQDLLPGSCQLPSSTATAIKEPVPQVRDDNIPGENRDDYKEALNMTIEPPHKPLQPLATARNKRRDPRRKTLTRSSTIELEERFQALERRLSQDAFPKDQQKVVGNRKPGDNVERTKHHIPSTAALEERYHTLEKQLSAEKQSREEQLERQLSAEKQKREAQLERKVSIEKQRREGELERQSSREAKLEKQLSAERRSRQARQPLEKQSSAEKANRKVKRLPHRTSPSKQSSESTCFEKPERIPSTADLETRFNALAKQMSSTESDGKAPLELQGKDQDGNSRQENGSEKNSKLHKTNEISKSETNKDNARTKTDSSDSKEAAEEKDAEKQPRLKKLPSTAELEDRFNALERKMSTQKNSPAKTKKEPPDENEEKPNKKAEQVEKPKTSTEEFQEEKSKIKENSEVEGNKQSTIKQQKSQKSSPVETAEEPKSSTKSKRKEESKIENEADSTSRKTPPSTEELEKRFNALEKRRSASSLDKADDTEAANKKKPAAKETQRVEESKMEEAQQSSIKSFEDKCKSVNAKLTIEKEDKAEAKRKSFEEKCKTTNQKLEVEGKDKAEKPNQAESRNEQKTVVTSDDQVKDLSKRRASEPPSTEDLEKRYETLKRRMSTRNHFSKDGSQNETVNEALERIEQEVIAEISEEKEPKEEEKKLPPTTADLESRYEALQQGKEATAKSSVDVAIEAHIPEPPPPPPPPAVPLPSDPGHQQQRALIEELQSKMKGQSPGEENLRPSDINPERKRQLQQRQLQQRPTPMGDETSEAPANTAYYRSGNYEPWQGQRMVRRFSDLPSRADLENRLQFLEKQLYKKFYKQRCASDSEVASRASKSQADSKPSTSRQGLAAAEAQLEQRVLALEKQLSENSLKLLEAMREKTTKAHIDEPSGSPRRFSTETIDATGKELVRYTHFGEVEEADASKPINISINIKMLLNAEEQKAKAEKTATTEELRRRLEQLEEQLELERAKNGAGAFTESETVEEVLVEEPVDLEESEEKKKEEKDNHNHSVKCDIPEKEEPEESTKHTEPEAVKETKTLENEVKAQARAKETTLNSEESTEETVKTKEQVEPETPKELTNTADQEVNPAEIQGTAMAKTVLAESEPSKKSAQTVESESTKKENMVINANDIGSIENNKTVVLLMDNEPKAVKVRRLTRANTEELEGLFQALEKQLNERNLIKSEDGKLVRAPENKPTSEQVEQAQAISDLTKEIEDFTSGNSEQKPTEQKPAQQNSNKETAPAKPAEEEDYDWGPNPVKHHLKRKTVYLPSTKELEARFRSLERQIKLLEDVEKIDVEQRLNEIERKIKLQYSLSHEKDLNKYLELCEGKGLDDDEPTVEETPIEPKGRSRSPARQSSTTKSPYTSPSRKATNKSPYTSPSRQRQKTPHTSPSPPRAIEKKKKSPYTSPARRPVHPNDLPISDDLEYKYRVLDLVRSKSKENLAKRKLDPNKKPPIHPLEMLLDPTPDDSEIPTTGELEHRIRVLDGKLKSPSRSTATATTPVRHTSRSRSPTIDDIKRKKLLDDQLPKTPVHNLERLVYSPTKPEPPTAEELEERIRALEEEQSFDFKTQKDYKEFNQKLKDVVSPSLSFEEFKGAKSREQSPRARGNTTPKSALRREDSDYEHRRHAEETPHYRPTSPKVIRFRDQDDEYYEEPRRSKSRPASERMTTIADHSSRSTTAALASAASSEGLDEFGSRLMRETSPITRTGTHTGVPLRTGENINDRLSSIKNTIKSIDTLCEEKPYQKEKCQRYIDSLFTDSLHFASKKNSLEDLPRSQSRSESRGRSTQRMDYEYTPSIRITSSTGGRSSEHRTLGSAESIRTTSPLRAASPLHYRSHRDISRELSPRRSRDAEEREERESSRVRRDNMLPNYFLDNRSELSNSGSSSLTKFHKVDRQLEDTYADERRSAARLPYDYNTTTTTTTTTTRYNYNYNNITITTTAGDVSCPRPRLDIDRPVSPYRPPYDPYKPATRSNTPVYQPAKLEIRHTTVTSTFYDRFLTEKQIEKQTLSSRSPIVSPSITSKSYTDLPQAAAGGSALSAYHYQRDNANAISGVSTSSTAGYVASMSNSYTGSSSGNYSYLTTHTISTSAVPASGIVSAQLSAPASQGSAQDLRIRSCDNIHMQLGKISTATTSTSISSLTQSYSQAIATTASSTTYASAYVPYSSSFITASRNSTAETTSSTLSYTTGVYNPMMSFTLRQPSGTATSSSGGGASLGSSGLLGQYSSGYSGYSPGTSKSFAESDKP